MDSAKIIRYLLNFVLVITIGLLLFLGYKYRGLIKQNAALEQEIVASDKKIKILHKKYEKGRNLESSFVRIRSTLEAQKRALEAEYESMRQEQIKILDEKKELKIKIKEISNSYEKRLEELFSDRLILKINNSEMGKKYNQALKIAMERKDEIERLNGVTDYMKSEVNRKNEELKSCRMSNKKLCEIAEEVLIKYQNKGVFDTILQKEPLTSVKTREIEKFVQDYLEKIDKENL